MQKNSNIWVVIPAYNEGEVIHSVVNAVISHGYKAVVVDDCSKDDTGIHAKNAGATVCRHLINLGQGAALQTGISYALKQGAQIIVTFDADGQHDANEIAKVCAPIVDNEADVSLGSRFLQASSAPNIPPLRRMILKLATLFTTLSTGLKLTDTHNGFRAFSAFAAGKLHIRQDRMAHASEILSEIAALKLRYTEVPVSIQYTEYSLKKGQKLSNSFNIIWESVTGGLRR